LIFSTADKISAARTARGRSSVSHHIFSTDSHYN
jgi:hypothetical protein